MNPLHKKHIFSDYRLAVGVIVASQIASPTRSRSGFRWVNSLCPLRTQSGFLNGLTRTHANPIDPLWPMLNPCGITMGSLSGLTMPHGNFLFSVNDKVTHMQGVCLLVSMSVYFKTLSLQLPSFACKNTLYAFTLFFTWKTLWNDFNTPRNGFLGKFWCDLMVHTLKSDK